MDLFDSNHAFPLSPMQQGMLFHSRFAPGSGVYVQQILGTLDHKLEAEVFFEAWRKVVARHAALRTSFAWEGLPEPVQVVHPSVEPWFYREDLAELVESVREKKINEYISADRARGFSFTEPSLSRLALFRCAENEWKFVWTFHHAILDGGSFGLILKEVFALYEAIVSNRDVEWREPRAFREYVEWIRKEDFSRSESFWREKLKGFQGADLPAATEDKANKDIGGAIGLREQTVSLSTETSTALRELAERHQFGLSTILQGAWALLLSRYTDSEDVAFGVTRSSRRSSIPGAEEMAGVFINTVPLRAQIQPEMTVVEWLKTIRSWQREVRAHEHVPMLEIQKWTGTPQGTPLFESVVLFDHATLNTALKSLGGEWEHREFRAINQTNFPLTVYGFAERNFLLKVEFDPERFQAVTIARMLGHLQSLLEGIAANPEQKVAVLSLLTPEERHQLIEEWNRTATEYPREKCIHELFEEQVKKAPDTTAIVFEGSELSWRELDERADDLAAHLLTLGVGPDVLVGISIERSLEMVVGLLGILKAGGAYVPLDPGYPADRLAHMIEDSRMPVIVTHGRIAAELPQHSAKVVSLDAIPSSARAAVRDGKRVELSNLAYVIYTSGSTGKPKGVMLTHRNVVNFFAGMDQVLGGDAPGTWLSVTSISFDISVLEIFWTLARGFKVVIQADLRKVSAAVVESELPMVPGKVDFSLFYFSGDEGQNAEDKYRLLLEGAKFADQNGLAAVWTPERHFHAFGGLYPNPSITSAAIAAVTSRIQIRAGSVVLPLHNPIRVAEEWAMVDNLSRGRVGLSFASGWHSNDFVFAPENYPDRKKIMFRQIETVRKLWKGEAVDCAVGDGKQVSVKIHPRPVRADVPLWITASSSPDTFRTAGEMGANVLTNLLGQTVEEVAEKIAIYREAWKANGHGPGEGQVTLMLHTFVERDMTTVKEKVRGPFTEYLRTSVDLIQKASSAWAFAAFAKPDAGSKSEKIDFKNLNPADMQALLDHAFERYFETSGLFGTPAHCLKLVNQLKRIGVDEIACLIDFGVEVESVLASLPYLSELSRVANRELEEVPTDRYSIPSQLVRHKVTHFQCTPSLARILAADSQAAAALSSVQEFLVGGEALPPSLAVELTSLVGGRVHNMYGPTETAIWSTTQLLEKGSDDVTIGRPLANTEIYLLDKHGQLVPIGFPGELHIGGEGVARGYFNRPELTAEKFITHPFRSESGARLYRTGDLARYRQDGTIEFLGRMDHQVKLRGHRIELGEIEAALAAHPSVKEGVVIAADDTLGDKRLIAYVVPSSALQPVKDGQASSNGDNGRLAHWQMIWDGAYADGKKATAAATGDAPFNVSGWASSYTGEPMPEAEMRDFVDSTVERILSLKPKRVLEIGCGTGLLLFRIAPRCAQYTATDFSTQALDYIRQELERRPLPQVQLMQGAADTLEDIIGPGKFDTVVINSVAQYFPDVQYLLRVIEAAVKRIAPGGRLFLGDIRSLPLLEAFHASIELHQASPDVTRDQFRARVQNRVAREEELVVSPEFFHALKGHLPRITDVDVRLKPGTVHNEVTRFRYDVILQIDGSARSRTGREWLDGADRDWNLSSLTKQIVEGQGSLAGIKQVPNSRLETENRLREWMNGGDGPETVGEFREQSAKTESKGIDPAVLRKRASAAGLDVVITWPMDADGSGAFDIDFLTANGEGVAAERAEAVVRRKPWTELANQPARTQSDTKLIGELRSHLRKSLPEIMVPSAFVVLAAMPLTPNGKINRRALPAPGAVQPQSSQGEFVALRTPVEQALAGIWGDVLGLERVGATDDFFKLGGHSLLATQLVSQVRELFKIELPLRALFESPRIGDLALRLVELESAPGMVERTAEILNQVEAMSAAEVEEALQESDALGSSAREEDMASVVGGS